MTEFKYQKLSIGTGVVSALSFWYLNSVMVRQGK